MIDFVYILLLSAFVLVGQTYSFGLLDLFTLVFFLLSVGDHKIRPFLSSVVPGMPKYLTKTSLVMSYWNITDMLTMLFFFGGCICRALFIFNTPSSVEIPILEFSAEPEQYNTVSRDSNPTEIEYYKDVYSDIQTTSFNAPHNYVVDNAKFYFIFDPSE